MKTMKDKKLQMIGNAHLDPVWLWNWQEGFQEVKATFQSVLDRMNEDDNFVFSCSSSVFYEWVEKNNTKMFEEIKKRVDEGRWELVGGWYIQPDCNIPSGESFVRQGLYAQRYFKEKFGKMAKTGYNVDSFGHNGNLPQILKKSGMDHYVFMRPMPLEKGLPGRIFNWQSDDGSTVLTYRIPYEYCTWGKDLEKHANRLKTELVGNQDYLMMFYGVGNHGGGPTKENIRSIYELNSREDMPTMTMGTIEDFFENIKQSDKEIPLVTGDLQHHASGCYSVHSAIKRQNRKAENLLGLSEYWSTVSKSVMNQMYPHNFEEAWKGVLFNQFHDILAGTSIASAYEDASYLYGKAMAIGQENLNYAIQAISWDIDIKEEQGMLPIVVFNSHAWKSNAVVEIEIRGLKNDDFRFEDSHGKRIPAQRIQSEATVTGQSKLLFVAELPSLGYQVYKLFLNTQEEQEVFEAVKVTDTILENSKYKITFNPATGNMKSLFDKREDLEVLRREGGRLEVLDDPYDTWAHNVFKFDQHITDMKPIYMKVIEEGPVRSTIRVKSHYNQSTIIQDFRLYQALDYVEVKCKIDWREPQTMVKVKYPVNFNFRIPTYEIPYGYIEKSANGEEEPGQTWFDFSGEHFNKGIMYGLSIANDSKYSYSFDIDEMGMTLLRNSVYAHHDPRKLEKELEFDYVDEGLQTLTYLLHPHKNSWKDSNIVKIAKELNQKPTSIIETYHKGNHPLTNAFIEMESEHILISAIKQSEDGQGIVIRAYESKRIPGEVILKVPFLERNIQLNFSANEIKTLLIPYSPELPWKEVNMLEM